MLTLLLFERYPEIIAIADKVGATPAQVLIAWGQLGGHSVIPKSVTPSRIASNYEQITLSDEHIKEISKLGEKYHRFNIRKSSLSLSLLGSALTLSHSTAFDYRPQWDIDVFGEKSEAGATNKVKII